MKSKIVSLLCLILIGFLLLVLFVSVQSAKARTINVDDDGGKDYMRIQDAINVSSPGDIVYVYNGTYNEQIRINKTISLAGESDQNTIIQGSSVFESKGVYITANYVNVRNFKIDNFDHGIYLSSSNNNITSNTVANCYYGVYLWHSSNNNITSNTIANSSGYGIYLWGSNNKITNNAIVNCTTDLRFDSSSSNNDITNTTITGSDGVVRYPGVQNNNTGAHYLTIQDGINSASTGDTIYVYNGTYNEQLTISKKINLIGESNQNTIIKGKGTSDTIGIYISGINYVNVNNLKIDAFDYGVYLKYSSNNIIGSNTIANSSKYGIWLVSSSNNIIISNIIKNGGKYGIYLESSSNNNMSSNTIANSNSGIGLYKSLVNNITSNLITNDSRGDCGISLCKSNNNIISSNTIINNMYGIGLFSSYLNKIAYNTFKNCEQDIGELDTVSVITGISTLAAWDVSIVMFVVFVILCIIAYVLIHATPFVVRKIMKRIRR